MREDGPAARWAVLRGRDAEHEQHPHVGALLLGDTLLSKRKTLWAGPGENEADNIMLQAAEKVFEKKSDVWRSPRETRPRTEEAARAKERRAAEARDADTILGEEAVDAADDAHRFWSFKIAGEYGERMLTLLKKCVKRTKFFSMSPKQTEKLKVAMAITNAKARVYGKEVRSFAMPKSPVATRWGSVIDMMDSLCLLEDVFAEFLKMDDSAPAEGIDAAVAAALHTTTSTTASTTATSTTTATTLTPDANDDLISESELQSPFTRNEGAAGGDDGPSAAVTAELQDVLKTEEADFENLDEVDFQMMRMLIEVFKPTMRMIKAVQTRSTSVHLPGMYFKAAVKELEAIK